MPVTATLGALSYARANLDVNREYWAVQPINDSKEFIQFNFDTGNNTAYILGGDSSSTTISKLNSVNGTPIDYVTNFQFTGANIQSNIKSYDFKDISSNIFSSVGAGVANYTPTFPYYQVGIGTLCNLRANGTVANVRSQWAWEVPPAATLVSELRWQVINKDNTGNIFIGQTDSYIYSGVSTRTRFAQIKKYDSNFAYLGGTAYEETTNATNTSTFFTSASSIEFDSTGNVVYFYSQLVNNNQSNFFIRKMDKTPGNANVLTRIWGTGLRSNVANTLLFPTDLKIDNDDKIYLTGYANNSNIGYFVKLYANGALEWQKALTNTKLFGTYIKSNTEIYTVGLKTDGNLWISEFDNTGNISWQNQLDYSANFNVNNDNNHIKIYQDSGNLYLGASGGDNWMLIKIPDNGNIPGDGNYTFSTGQTLTYANANVTINAGNLQSANITTFDGFTPLSNNFLVRSATVTNVGTNRRICFLD